MKLFKKEKRNHVHYATYEKFCPCCGRRFRAAYPANDMYLSQTAKDMVMSNYNTHKLFCLNASSALKHTA